MRIAVVKESRPGEKRVAASPETVKKLSNRGLEVFVQMGAGAASSFVDDDYESAEGVLVSTFKETVEKADLILKVQKPVVKGEKGLEEELKWFSKDAMLIALLSPLTDQDQLKLYAQHSITAFSMDMIPRISRAQSMDVLSSQSSLAGYRSVLDAAHEYGRAFPMMMTAAGTITPAKVLILGAGVAGLQAIATAKRLGASVSAFDVRPTVKEQVESLGATFVEVDNPDDANAETKGGYAQEMSEDYKKRQSKKIEETLAKSDIAITTALIPGKPAPRLISEDMVDHMKPGSVIVDMAIEAGGNCAVSQADQIVNHRGVKVIAYRNIPSRIPQDASRLYARNIFSFLDFLLDKDNPQITLNQEDEIIKGTLLTHQGNITHDLFKNA